MEQSEQHPTVSGDSRWANPLHKLPRTAGWMLLVNLFLGFFFFLQLQWYLENIYRFAPWIPFISYDRIDTVIDVLWGAFMVHVGAPLARGRLEILSHPEKFLDKAAVGLFSHRSTAVAAAGLTLGVYGLIAFSPALHLSHSTVAESPVVQINGTRRNLPAGNLPLLGNEMNIDQTEILVTGKHGFYRVGIQPNDVKSFWLFPSHKQVNLNQLFLRRDLVTTLHDSYDRRLASFKFHYQNDNDIATQCGESELQGRFSEDPAACVSLLRRIMADMSENPEARLLRDFDGTVTYRGRLYRYSYSFGPELALAITAPEAESEFANAPGEALNRFRSAGAEERERLVSEFANDVGNLSSTALEEVFQIQFASDEMYGYLDGTTSQKMDTLNFARDVLSLGVDHVTALTVEDLVTRVLDGNLSLASDDKVFVPAMDALVALSRGSASLRSTVLEKVEEFVNMLGTHHNAAKPAIAGILLNALGDSSSGAESERLVALVRTIRQNAVGAGRTVELIDEQIRERIGEVRDPSAIEGLRAEVGGAGQVAIQSKSPVDDNAEQSSPEDP